MITIHSRDDRSPETEAARLLGSLASKHDSDIADSRAVVLDIFPSAQCFGQKVQDIDLVVFFADYRPEAARFRTASGTVVQSVCVTIELKGHPPEDVRFDGAHCSVFYKGHEHDVTGQSEKQKYSLRQYIQSQKSRIRAPWITNLIWLSRVNESSLPSSTSNILGMDTTWCGFLEKCAQLSSAHDNAVISTFGSRDYMLRVSDIFSRRLIPSRIDRKKMEAITTTVLDKQQYRDKLGQQLLIFRGRGGTGKTVRLLQIAVQSYVESGSRVLILTYNKALVADISRTLLLAGIKNSIGGQGVLIQSIHSFMYHLLVSLDVVSKTADDFLIKYDEYKREAISLLSAGALNNDDISKAFAKDSLSLRWDLIMIDEAQDWPSDEREILYKIFGSDRFVIADGVDQLVRSVEVTDWRDGVDPSRTQIVPLHKSMRLKSSLCQAVTHFAEQLEVPHWKLEPVPETQGGRVIVITGDPFEKDFYTKLTNSAKQDGNKPIDILLCVPPSWVRDKESGGKESLIAAKIRDWGLDVWDAVDADNRDTMPTSLDQYRVVQYESCRGLEGWIAVCLALDKFYDYKVKTAKFAENQKSDFFFDENESAISYAKRWLMIPLTRAIDTLVIHIEDENSYVGQALRSLHKRYPHDVTWQSLGS